MWYLCADRKVKSDRSRIKCVFNPRACWIVIRDDDWYLWSCLRFEVFLLLKHGTLSCVPRCISLEHNHICSVPGFKTHSRLVYSNSWINHRFNHCLTQTILFTGSINVWMGYESYGFINILKLFQIVVNCF